MKLSAFFAIGYMALYFLTANPGTNKETKLFPFDTALSVTKTSTFTQDKRIIIHGASVFTASDRGQIDNCTIVIHGDQIEWVGPATETPDFENTEVLNAEGKFIIPGLIDAHVHLFDENQLAVYLANGVTTVFNMTGTLRILDWAKEIGRDPDLVQPFILQGLRLKMNHCPSMMVSLRSAHHRKLNH